MHTANSFCTSHSARARSEPGGIRWRTGGEVKGKQANGVGSQYNSTLPPNVVCPALLPLLLLIRTPRLPVVDWTDALSDLNELVRFGVRRILVSARMPSRSARAILQNYWYKGCLAETCSSWYNTCLPIKCTLLVCKSARLNRETHRSSAQVNGVLLYSKH